MQSILYLRGVGHETPAFFDLPEAGNIKAKLPRELEPSDFDDYKAILIPSHINQRALIPFAPFMERFLNRGGVLVFNGHLVYPVIPGLSSFVPAQGGRLEDLIVERVNNHPIFEGVNVDDLSFRRGVAGFYGRGSNPPPSGALILHRLKKDGSVIDWVWHRPEGGVIFMHTGNPMWMFVNDDTSAARIAPRLLVWVNTLLGNSMDDIKRLMPARPLCDGKCAQKRMCC
ncbi:MAG: hypothetical protein LBG61_03600 [Burkholderiales bacterium]|jgi:hypothetical protein|nr:hypothetical protein [Burkholderiales bacterium]